MLPSALLIAAAGLAFGPAAVSLVDVWLTNPLYSFGVVVPFIAAYVWRSKAAAVASVPSAPDYVFGAPVLLFAVAMLMIGRLGAMLLVEQASLLVAATGIMLLVRGRETVRVHWFVFAYLAIAIPIWNLPIDALQEPSRLLSAKIATSLLSGIGVPAMRDGTKIVLSTHTLGVLRECSGVNQLIALAAMVVPAAYLWLPTVSRRLLLLALSIGISYLGNGARIALVGWLAVNGHGDGDLNGPAHLAQGLAISVLQYAAIGTCMTVLARGAKQRAAPTVPEPAPAVRHRRLSLDLAVVTVMLLAAVSRVSAASSSVATADALRSLDMTIGTWTVALRPPRSAISLPNLDDALVSVGQYPSETGERHFVGVDDELLRTYRSSEGSYVQLYIGYYARQEQGRELTGEAAHALQGVAADVRLNTESGPLSVKEVVQEKDGVRRGVLYWYDINGRVVSDLFLAKRLTIWDGLTRRRTNGAVVMLAWTGATGPDADKVRQQTLEFARSLMPILRRRLPA